MPFLHDIREWLEAPVQDSIHIGDGDAVVCHWNLLILCTFQTILHLPLAECTATAMDDQSIRGQIGRKFGSACENEFQFLAGIIPDPAR